MPQNAHTGYEHMLTAHLNILWWVNLKFYFLTSIICLQNISVPSSQSKPWIYMCCLLGSVGSSWHIHLSLLCVLEQNLIPESTLTWFFLGQQLHYWAPAWWTTPLLLWREGPNTAQGGGHGKMRWARIWDKQNDEVERGNEGVWMKDTSMGTEGEKKWPNKSLANR